MECNGHRLRWAAVLAGALALAGCGGGDEQEAARETLPADVARQLARASDRVAASIEAGEDCVAVEEAADLRAAALVAVDEGRVPQELARPLLAAVERLERQIECVEVTEPDEDEGEDEDEEKEPKGKDKGKDKNDDQEDDEDEEPPDETSTQETTTGETTTGETTTEEEDG